MSSRFLVSSLCCGGLVAIAVSGAAAAGGIERQSQGADSQSPPLAPLPAGNGTQAFAFDPRNANTMYVTSAHAPGGAYIFKTTDNGGTWRSTGAQGRGWESDVLSLTADPQHPGTLYAGTDTAVYKTVNGGRSWRPFKEGLFPRRHKVCSPTFGGARQCWNYPYYGTPGQTNWNRGNGWVLDITVDPIHSNIVYSAAGGIRKSTDGGRTWKSVFKPRRWKRTMVWGMVSRMAIAPTHPESIYAIAHGATGATAIYKSTDAGRTWQTTGAHSSLPPSCCGDGEDALAVDAGNPQTLYAVVGNTVSTTSNGGISWHAMANGLAGNAVTSLAADPRQSGTVYASVDNPHSYKTQAGDVEKPTGGIYETTDGGQTWAKLWSGFGVDKVAVDPIRPTTIYASGWAGRDPTHANEVRLLRSTNGGLTWTIAG